MKNNNMDFDVPYPKKGEVWAPARADIISQILLSEKQYVQHLYHFIFEIRVSLAEASDSQVIMILPDAVENLFRRIAPIYKLNLNFLTLLESSIASDSSQSRIGDCFNSTVTLLKTYVDYASDYATGISALTAQFQIDRNLAPTLKEIESNIGLTVLELLRLPIERIPRYRRQLLKLLNVTPREHLDRSATVAAYIQITPMCEPFENLLIEIGKEELQPIDAKYKQVKILSEERFLMFHDVVKCFTDKEVVDMHLWLFSNSVLVGFENQQKITPVLFQIKNINAISVDLPSPYEDGVDFMTSVDSYRIAFKNRKRKEYFCEVCENLKIDLQIGKDGPSLAPVRTPYKEVKDCVLCGKAFNLAIKPCECGFCRKWYCKKCISMHEIGYHIVNVCNVCQKVESFTPRPHMLIDYSFSQVFKNSP